MRAPAVIPTTRDRSATGLIAIGILGSLLALAIGATAVTSHTKLVAGALVGLAFCGIAVAVYLRDPILALIWLWLIEVFNTPLSAAASYGSASGEVVRQSDELLVLLFIALTIRQTARTKTPIPSLRFILPGVGIALIGLLGSVLHNVPLTVIIIGAFLGLKLWIIIVITLMLPWKLADLSRVYTVFTRVGVFVAVLGLVDYFTHAAISRALHTSIYSFSSESFRGEAVHSIFPHPGEFSLFMSLLFALAFSRFATKHNLSDLLLALLFAGSIMLSLRLKGFLSLAAVMAIVACVQGMANSRGAIAVLLIGALLFAGIYSVEGNVISKQISTYSSSESTARARLYTTGARIATDNFPLGVGFGRFASYASRLDYSPVYHQYELNTVWGLSSTYPDFIDDTSWPSVIGETGYGGLAVDLVGIALLVLALIRRLRAVPASIKWAPLGTLCALAALLVDSLGDPTLFDWVAVTTFAMILGPTLVATRNLAQSSAGSFRLDEGHGPLQGSISSASGLKSWTNPHSP